MCNDSFIRDHLVNFCVFTVYKGVKMGMMTSVAKKDFNLNSKSEGTDVLKFGTLHNALRRINTQLKPELNGVHAQFMIT